MGLLEVLTIVFIVLKLIGVIAWSWWLVLSPLLVAVGIYVTLVAVMLLVFTLTGKSIHKGFKTKNRKR